MSARRSSHKTAVGKDIALSIVIPLYKDEGSLEAIFERCDPVMAQIEGEVELVLVDDGSPDQTARIACEMGEKCPHQVTVVRLARNFGQHPAVFAGLEVAQGKAVATLDSDLQYPPEELPKLLAAMSDEHPVVSGCRLDRQDPLFRRLITTGLTRWLNSRTGSSLKDFGSMFRVYDHRVVKQMLLFTERHRFVPAIVAWLGVPIKEIPITHSTRGQTGSRYRVSTLLDLFLDLVTGYSVFPLRIVTGLGLMGSALGFVGTILFAIYRLSVGGGVSGTVSAFALLFGLIGVQLLLVALIGEYVGRIYTETKARPYFVVAELVQYKPAPTSVNLEASIA